MYRTLAAFLAVLTLAGLMTAQPNEADGSDEILAVVNGEPITYTEIAGDMDMQSEINTVRAERRIPPETPDSEIEAQLVSQRLRSYVLKKLLDAEAEKMQLKISNSQMRQVINSQKRQLHLDINDTRAWANYLKSRYNLTPTEYRERTRNDVRRNEIMYRMAGYYGPLPPQIPLEIYFDLSVTPRDVRRDFDKTADTWRVARNIDFERLRVLYPPDTMTLEAKRKLYEAVNTGDNCVRERVIKNESLSAASDGLSKLIDEIGIPGLKLEISKRKTVKDDTELDPQTYQMVLSVAATGGVSELGYATDTNEEGQKLEGFQFVKLYSRVDGDRRDFTSPKIQEGIRTKLFQERLAQNQAKVEKALMKRAAIVPEKLFVR